MTEPTKGPYEACGTLIVCRDERKTAVGCGYGPTQEQAIANAQLLAAAWEMREAIERKLADCREHGDCSDAGLMPGEYCSNECVALAAALARADGKETKNEHAK